MRRRVKTWTGPGGLRFPPPAPVDDVSLSLKVRLRRFREWRETYYEPWLEAKREYEEKHDVLLMDSGQRDFFGGWRGHEGGPRFVFVDNMPGCPDAPWDPDEI